MSHSLADAAKALRDSVAALLVRHRDGPWRADDSGNVFGYRVNAWIGEQHNAATAQHVALAASPDVVTALADLLDVIAAAAYAELPLNEPADVVHGWIAYEALAAAILRGRP